MDQDIAKAIIDLKDAILSINSKGFGLSDFKDLVIIAGTIIGVIKIHKEIANYQRTHSESKNAKERENIDRKLNTFFAPLKVLRAESVELYRHFAVEEKEKANANNEIKFRTLRHLAQGNTFSSQDMAILDEIICVGKKQLRLLEREGFVKEDSNLAELFGLLGAHIRLLELAKNKKLNGMSEVLEDIVYPLEIDGAIESEIKKLLDQRFKLLSARKGRSFLTSIIEDDIEISQTISYYDKNADSYFSKTAYIDLTEVYKKFRECVACGGTLLDAGCGVGRDTRYFIKKGYKVVSFDASFEMVKLCNRYSFSYCLQKKFSEIDYIEEFDGVWACSSLLHLSDHEFNDSLRKLSNALRPGGVIYFSLKERPTKHYYSPVKEYYYDDDYILNAMTKELKFILLEKWNNTGKKDSTPVIWNNYLFRKPKLY